MKFLLNLVKSFLDKGKLPADLNEVVAEIKNGIAPKPEPVDEPVEPSKKKKTRKK